MDGHDRLLHLLRQQTRQSWTSDSAPASAALWRGTLMCLFESPIPGHYVQMWRRAQNWRYITYGNVARGGTSHGNVVKLGRVVSKTDRQICPSEYSAPRLGHSNKHTKHVECLQSRISHCNVNRGLYTSTLDKTDWLSNVYIPLNKNRSFQICSSQPVTWPVLKKTKPNKTN